MTDHRGHVQVQLETGGWMRICPVAPHTFRIRFHNSGDFTEPPLIRYGILANPESFASCSTEDTGRHLRIQSGQALLAVSKADGRLVWSDGRHEEKTRTSGAPLLSSVGFDIRFVLREREALYGLGDAGTARMQRRGSTVSIQMDKRRSFAPVPFMMSSAGWALLINTTYGCTFDAGCLKGDELLVTGLQDSLDFYLFLGQDYAELLDRYTNISGKPALLPLWAYGLTFLTSKPSSEQNVSEAALKFRQLGIPCDLIDIAPDWTERDNDRSVGKRWHPQRYPTMAYSDVRQRRFTFIHALRRHGFKLSLYLLGCDFDLTELEERRKAEAGGAEEAEEARNAEGTNAKAGAAAEANDCWYAHLRKYVDDGISAFILSRGVLSDLQTDRVRANGMSGDQLRHLYPLLLGKQMGEGFRRQTGKRPMLFGPLGYTGMQQYGAIATGDSENGALETLTMLNCCLSGFSHTSTNMPEMFTAEGIHAGFLQAWSRLGRVSFHLQHPGFLNDSMLKLFVKYARLRYSLLPYLYSAAHAAARTGLPIVRPMPVAFPEDPTCAELAQQYMLGDSLLVAVYTDRVYLPKGVWINFWTGEACVGGSWLTCGKLDDTGGPLFVRGGAIIPQWPSMEYVGQIEPERIIVRFYPCKGVRGEFTLYEDDGETLHYLDGHIAVTTLQCETDETKTVVRIARRNGAYEGMPAGRRYELIVHTANKPIAVRSDGKSWTERQRRGMTKTPGNWRYDKSSSAVLLFVEEADEPGKEVRIDLLWRPAQERLAPEQAKDLSLSRTVNRHQHDEVVIAALEQGSLSAAELAIKTWWNAGLKKADSGEDWRLYALKGCMLIIRLAEQRGWTAKEVFGANMETVFAIHSLPSPAHGSNLLVQFTRQLLQHNPDKQTAAPFHPVVRETLAIIERELDGDLSLQQLAGRVGVHPFHLSRLFKKEIGSAFSDYILQQRMNAAKTWLESGKKVYEAAALVGFKDAKHFSRSFRHYWGVSPKTIK